MVGVCHNPQNFLTPKFCVICKHYHDQHAMLVISKNHLVVMQLLCIFEKNEMYKCARQSLFFLIKVNIKDNPKTIVMFLL